MDVCMYWIGYKMKFLWVADKKLERLLWGIQNIRIK